MIIDYFSIDKNSYKLISLRSTDTSIISSDCIALENSQVNRILIKFFNLHPISNSLLKKIHKEKGDSFYIHLGATMNRYQPPQLRKC